MSRRGITYDAFCFFLFNNKCMLVLDKKFNLLRRYLASKKENK